MAQPRAPRSPQRGRRGGGAQGRSQRDRAPKEPEKGRTTTRACATNRLPKNGSTDRANAPGPEAVSARRTGRRARSRLGAKRCQRDRAPKPKQAACPSNRAAVEAEHGEPATPARNAPAESERFQKKPPAPSGGHHSGARSNLPIHAGAGGLSRAPPKAPRQRPALRRLASPAGGKAPPRQPERHPGRAALFQKRAPSARTAWCWSRTWWAVAKRLPQRTRFEGQAADDHPSYRLHPSR